MYNTIFILFYVYCYLLIAYIHCANEQLTVKILIQVL